MDGCASHCCQYIHHVSVIDILSYHNYFQQLNKEGKQRWLLEYFNTHSFILNSSQMEVSFFVCGKQVCQPIWISTLGISSSNFYTIRKKFINGSLTIVKEAHRKPSQKTNEAVAWMTNYFDLVADRLPHRMVVHLPSNLSKVGIYQRMIVDFKTRSQHRNIVSKSHFFKLWDDHFPQVTIPKVIIYLAYNYIESTCYLGKQIH